jgi:hypothetical protein
MVKQSPRVLRSFQNFLQFGDSGVNFFGKFDIPGNGLDFAAESGRGFGVAAGVQRAIGLGVVLDGTAGSQQGNEEKKHPEICIVEHRIYTSPFVNCAQLAPQ